MTRAALAGGLFAMVASSCGLAWGASAIPSTDPLAAIDLNRNAIIADIVQGFEGDRVALAKRLAGLRADRLLAVSLTSTRESLESILNEAEKSRDAVVTRASAKVLGSPTSDLVYTPLTPCRLIDTRGFGAPIQGGAFAPNARRSYSPNGLCSLPTTGVATILISFTTENLTPNSGGYLAILAPAAPVTTSVDVFNLGAEWSASNTAVATGPAAQFDVLVAVANAQVVIDVLGYFAPPQGGAVTSITAGTGLTGGTITSAGTIALAATNLLPTVACATNQIPKWSGSAWACAADATSGGTVTAVGASAPLASSGGNTPNISLTGTIPVANGGTGQATLAANGIVYGQGGAALGTALGVAGQVLSGTAGAPAWTGSPSISGNLTLVNPSTASTGSVMKGANPFIHNFGSSNTFIGENAGNFTMSGIANTASGVSALSSNTTGNYNTASGSQSLVNNSIGVANTASGWRALYSNTTGSTNTASGTSALSSNTTGYSNTAIGYQSLVNNSIGVANTASGHQALSSNTTGIYNTASGFEALSSNTTGSSNTASGSQSLVNNSIGVANTASGWRALYSNTTGSTNTASGTSALSSNTTGSSNTAIGYQALRDTTASFNTASGSSALQNNTTGDGNTANGQAALRSNTTGNYNTASGASALQSNTTGNYNTASGFAALNSNTTGNRNTASGASALSSNTTGTFNTASGTSALSSNTTGDFNTASGFGALFSNFSGCCNTANGYQALYGNTTGTDNTASGTNVLLLNTSGSFNTASGRNTLANNTTGNYNIALGYGAGAALTTGNLNIDIGHTGVAGESQTIRIGDANQTRAFISGIVGVPTGSTIAVPVLIDINGQLGTAASSRRYKDDIADMDAASSALMKLRPVTFHYKTDKNPSGRTLQYGLIAEEVADIYPGLVAHSADGQVETVMYQFLPSMLLNEVQKQQRTMEAQATHIAELERERQTQTAEIAGLKAAVAKIAELEQQTAHLARLLDQQRTGAVTAGLGLK